MQPLLDIVICHATLLSDFPVQQQQLLTVVFMRCDTGFWMCLTHLKLLYDWKYIMTCSR